VGLPAEVMVVDCYTCRYVGQMSRLAQHTGKRCVLGLTLDKAVYTLVEE